MSRYKPAKRNWCSKCRALVLIDRDVKFHYDKVYEHIRCTRCDHEILLNDITERHAADVGLKAGQIVVPDLEMVRLSDAAKVKT